MAFFLNFQSLYYFCILSVLCDKLVSLAFLLVDKNIFLMFYMLPLFSPCISWLFTKLFYKQTVSHLHRTSLVSLFYTLFILQWLKIALDKYISNTHNPTKNYRQCLLKGMYWIVFFLCNYLRKNKSSWKEKTLD